MRWMWKKAEFLLCWIISIFFVLFFCSIISNKLQVFMFVMLVWRCIFLINVDHQSYLTLLLCSFFFLILKGTLRNESHQKHERTTSVHLGIYGITLKPIFSLILFLHAGRGWGCRVSKQCNWVLYHDSRSRQCIWHQLRHRGDPAEAFHQIYGDRAEYHQAEGLQVVSGGPGQGPGISILQHNSCGQHWHHRGGKAFILTLSMLPLLPISCLSYRLKQFSMKQTVSLPC